MRPPAERRRRVRYAGARNSLSWLTLKRFDSFHNQIYKGAKAQGILTNMPSYFNKGAEQVKAADLRVEKLKKKYGTGTLQEQQQKQ